jgi:hypothetical protein
MGSEVGPDQQELGTANSPFAGAVELSYGRLKSTLDNVGEAVETTRE